MFQIILVEPVSNMAALFLRWPPIKVRENVTSPRPNPSREVKTGASGALTPNPKPVTL